MIKIAKVALGILGVLILFSLLGLGIYGLGRLYLSIIGSSVQPLSVTTDARDKQVFSLDKLDVYYLQYGVFNEVENAQEYYEELEQMGIKTVITPNSPYKVVSGYFYSFSEGSVVLSSTSSAAFAASKSVSAELKGIRPVPKQVSINVITFSFKSGAGADIKTILTDYAMLLNNAVILKPTTKITDISAERYASEVSALLKHCAPNVRNRLENRQTQVKQSNKIGNNTFNDNAGIKLKELVEQGKKYEQSLLLLKDRDNTQSLAIIQNNLLLLLFQYNNYVEELRNIAA